MKVRLALCAEGSSVDKATNKLSIFNVIDKMNSMTYPLFMPKLCFVFAVDREENENLPTSATLRVLSAESIVSELRVPMSFSPDGSSRSVANLNNLVIPKPGKLSFQLTWEQGSLELYSMLFTQLLAHPSHSTTY